MQLILDTANLEQIKLCNEWFQITGVTTNPSIICREHTDFLKQLYTIKEIIGEKQLHVQSTGHTWQEMLEDAVTLSKIIDKDIYVKIPSNYEGFRAMKEIKDKGIHVTATVVYSPEQAFLSGLAGADYVAVYYNKMYNINMDPEKTVREIIMLYKENGVNSNVVTASFRNSRQVIESFLAGAQAVTVPYIILEEFWKNSAVTLSVDKFEKEWSDEYGGKSVRELLRM